MGGSEKASVLAATSTWNALSMGHTLGGRDRCPEMGSTREARSWGSTSLGTKGYKKKIRIHTKTWKAQAWRRAMGFCEVPMQGSWTG